MTSDQKRIPIQFNNRYMGITERFLWELKWGAWKPRRVVSFQRINESTSCSSMLGFHTVMKSRFLSSTKDVAHLFGMMFFFFFLGRIASDFSPLCVGCLPFCLRSEDMSSWAVAQTVWRWPVAVLSITDVTHDNKTNNNNSHCISWCLLLGIHFWTESFSFSLSFWFL